MNRNKFPGLTRYKAMPRTKGGFAKRSREASSWLTKRGVFICPWSIILTLQAQLGDITASIFAIEMADVNANHHCHELECRCATFSDEFVETLGVDRVPSGTRGMSEPKEEDNVGQDDDQAAPGAVRSAREEEDDHREQGHHPGEQRTSKT